jgi:hypothetical protein
MKITVFRDFSFGASKVVPMHAMKACEEVQISSILNTGSGCRRCATLSDLTDIHPCFGRICFLPSTLRYEAVLRLKFRNIFTGPCGVISQW